MTALQLHKRKYDSFSRPSELKSLLSSSDHAPSTTTSYLICTRTR
jgi:hypothetical protein